MLENKLVSLHLVRVFLKKGESNIEGMSAEVIENKPRKNVAFLVCAEVIDK